MQVKCFAVLHCYNMSYSAHRCTMYARAHLAPAPSASLPGVAAHSMIIEIGVAASLLRRHFARGCRFAAAGLSRCYPTRARLEAYASDLQAFRSNGRQISSVNSGPDNVWQRPPAFLNRVVDGRRARGAGRRARSDDGRL